MDFQVGGIMQTCKCEQTRRVRGHYVPQGNFKFKSAKMAINASKTANSDRLMESVIITSALRTTSYNLAPMLGQN